MAPCTYIPHGLSRGNGTTKLNILPIYLTFSRLMVITGTLTLVVAIAFL